MGANLAPGMRIGRYQLLFRLGKGGMGEVWAAGLSQAELGFQKLVALKVLKSRDLESNAAVMFFDEAKAASALQHAAIVNTTDLGQDGDVLYIAMDLVRGPSLTALLQRLVITQKKMSPAVVAHIGIRLSSALDYAHDRALVNGQPLRLVHRDVSPHNVLIDLNGSIRLTDFGVARTAIQDHESRVGTVRGKPSYMAPEQVVGGKIDARTDLFALGIVLYECSCLKRLFGRSQPVKSMDAVMKHTPKPLPDLVPDYPQTLWSVIRKALDKDPSKRFQSAGQMCEALTNAASGLEGFDAASRHLVELVHDVFDEDAFDTDARVRDALASAAPPETEAEPTTNARPLDTGIQVLGTAALPEPTAAWPSADASDPLAPEAIEEARTAYRSVHNPAIMPAPAVMMQSGSMDALTPAGTHHSYTGLVSPPPKRSSTVALAVTAAALALAGTTAFVIASRGSGSKPIPAEPARSAPGGPSVAPKVAVEPQPVLRASPRPAPAPREAAEPKPEPELEPEAPTKRANRRVVRRAPPPPPPKAAADATYEEVRALVKQVRKVDSQKGRAMLVTLVEAGKQNPKVLNKLRREAKQVLESQP